MVNDAREKANQQDRPIKSWFQDTSTSSSSFRENHEATISEELSCSGTKCSKMADGNENKIYVGSLSYGTTKESLTNYFNSVAGEVIDGEFPSVPFSKT